MVILIKTKHNCNWFCIDHCIIYSLQAPGAVDDRSEYESTRHTVFVVADLSSYVMTKPLSGPQTLIRRSNNFPVASSRQTIQRQRFDSLAPYRPSTSWSILKHYLAVEELLTEQRR